MPKFKSPIANRQSPIVILGIDPGLADTGFGVIEKLGHQLTAIDCGSIKTPAKTLIENRLKTIYQELNKLIKKYRPQLIGVEQIFFAKNAKTAIAVSQARGVILLNAGQHHIPIVEFSPLQVKMALTSYGQASKNQVEQMVKIILKLKSIPKPDDAADALAIAICSANQS